MILFNLNITRRSFIQLRLTASFLVFLLFISMIAKSQALNFTASTCPGNGSITVTVTGPGAGAPYIYSLTGCGASMNQAGQPATYTFTGIPQHNCSTNITVTDNAGAIKSKSVFMSNIFFPGVLRVYTIPCGAGTYSVIPIKGPLAGNANLLYTLYAADGTTIIAGPQSNNVFSAVAGNAGDNLVMGIKQTCGGESFAPITLANSTALNGTLGCFCVLDNTGGCYAAPAMDSIAGASYTWIDPHGTVFPGYTNGPPSGVTENGVWNVSASFASGGCTHTLSNAFPITCISLPHLPVKYNYVRVSSSNCKAKAEWSIAGEDNTDKYEIETSSNGHTDWLKVATVAANGLSGANHEYSAELPGADALVVYVRIKQIDKDDHFTYSMIVKADMSCDGIADKLSVNPNPVQQNGSIALKIESSGARGRSSVLFTDITGRQFLNKIVTINRSLNRYEFPVTGFPKGTYFVKIISADGSWYSNTVKLLVQ